MDCRQVKAKLADWSADNLPDSFCEELREHLGHCPHCALRWAEFQHTLHITNTSTQSCCSPDVSRAMWQHCEQHIQKKTVSESKPLRRVWWQFSPRVGFASLAGACAIFFGVLLAPPRYFVSNVSAPSVTSPQTQTPRDEWIRFSLPPRQASPFINHHTAMAFDPFADHVASTLISDASTNSGEDVSVIPIAETQGAAKRDSSNF